MAFAHYPSNNIFNLYFGVSLTHINHFKLWFFLFRHLFGCVKSIFFLQRTSFQRPLITIPQVAQFLIIRKLEISFAKTWLTSSLVLQPMIQNFSSKMQSSKIPQLPKNSFFKNYGPLTMAVHKLEAMITATTIIDILSNSWPL